jgi:hypothetical protein
MLERECRLIRFSVNAVQISPRIHREGLGHHSIYASIKIDGSMPEIAPESLALRQSFSTVGLLAKG